MKPATTETQRGDRDGRPVGELPAELLRRLPQRDPAALAAFYDVWFDRVYGFVRRMVGEDHLAEDLTQEVFLNLHRALPSYDPDRPLKPWVLTIATNRVRDHWRSRRHRGALREVELDRDERGEIEGPDGAGPREVLEGRELSDTIARAIGELPEMLRTTLVLRWFEGLSFEQIGRMVDRNEVAVRKRFSRALEELRRSLGPELAQGDQP